MTRPAPPSRCGCPGGGGTGGPSPLGGDGTDPAADGPDRPAGADGAGPAPALLTPGGTRASRSPVPRPRWWWWWCLPSPRGGWWRTLIPSGAAGPSAATATCPVSRRDGSSPPCWWACPPPRVSLPDPDAELLPPPDGPEESFPDPLEDLSSPLDVVARPSPADAVTFAGPPEVDVPLLSEPEPEP